MVNPSLVVYVQLSSSQPVCDLENVKTQLV